MGSDTTYSQHLLDRINADVAFLQSQGVIRPDAASQIKQLLSTGNAAPAYASTPSDPVSGISQSFSNLMNKSTLPVVSHAPMASQPPPPVQHQPVTSGPKFVRALYDYQNPGDLSFRAGDMIEVTPAPTDNDDWWTGRLNGVTGIFPSNHVEKVASPPSYGPTAHRVYGEKPPIQSWNSAPAGPSTPSGYQPPFQGYPQQPPSAPSQPEQPGEEPKKSKFQKIGGKVGNAAAGGLGFGAGAAIGSGIVNAIF